MHQLISALSKCMCKSYIDLTKPIKMSTVATSAARSDLNSSALSFLQTDKSVQRSTCALVVKSATLI